MFIVTFGFHFLWFFVLLYYLLIALRSIIPILSNFPTLVWSFEIITPPLSFPLKNLYTPSQHSPSPPLLINNPLPIFPDIPFSLPPIWELHISTEVYRTGFVAVYSIDISKQCVNNRMVVYCNCIYRKNKDESYQPSMTPYACHFNHNV